MDEHRCSGKKLKILKLIRDTRTGKPTTLEKRHFIKVLLNNHKRSAKDCRSTIFKTEE